jgi:predicted O-methyltransferase YrrM
MQQSRSYWSFLFRSKGRHGVHSPFVFQLVDKCLTTKVDKNFQTARKKWLRQLQKQREPFEINDLGVGSKKMKRTRSISQLSKTASSKGLYGDVLWQLMHYFQPKTILEFGTSIGIGTVALKMGYPSAKLVTVEGCDQTLSKAYQQLDYWKLDGILPICSSFDDFLKLPSIHSYDVVYLDGNHQGTATLHYIETLQHQTHNETLFIVDDIRWSEDMWNAWKSIVMDERFHVTIDLGRMGLFWRRTQQTKEHFTIRPKVVKTRFF